MIDFLMLESWLADWWLKYGYMKFREPLLPLLNIVGPFAEQARR